MSAVPQSAAAPQSLAHALQVVQTHVASQMPAEMYARLSAAIEEMINSKPAAHALRAGQKAPGFSLPDLDGKPVALSEQLRAGPAIVTFYRGSWCPYCDLMLRTYSTMVPQLQNAGARLIAISPQRPDAEVPNAVGHRGLGFPVLTDAGNRVAREYGLVYPVGSSMSALFAQFGMDSKVINGAASWELPVPATYLVTRDGQIRWASVDADYRRRPEPEQILRALAEL